MYHESIVIPGPDAEVRAYLVDNRIPIVAISGPGGEHNEVKIQLPNSMSLGEKAAWLRGLAVQLEELAEQVDQTAGTTLANQHIAEAKAAAGIGGAS